MLLIINASSMMWKLDLKERRREIGSYCTLGGGPKWFECLLHLAIILIYNAHGNRRNGRVPARVHLQWDLKQINYLLVVNVNLPFVQHLASSFDGDRPVTSRSTDVYLLVACLWHLKVPRTMFCLFVSCCFTS